MSFQVVASRSDGLCMRILAMLAAQTIAEEVGGTFRFHWPVTDFPPQDQHTVADPSLIFAPDYLRSRMVAGAADAAPVLLSETGDDRAEILALAQRVGVLHVESPNVSMRGRPPRARSASDIFWAIGWSDTVQTAMDAAHALPIEPNAVALHIRGGDILHGSTSNTGLYAHKAVSIFEAEALVEQLVAAGKQVWLIGQEPDLIAHISASHHHVHSLGLVRDGLGLDPVQSVFFDVVALSRMAAIYGGNSGVARLASRIGSARWVDTMRLNLGLAGRDFVEDPLSQDAYAALSPSLKSHSYYKLFYLMAPEDWTEAELSLARLMLQWRPQSQYAKLVLCLICARFDRWIEAEELAAEVIGPMHHEGWPDVVIEYVLADEDRFDPTHLAILEGADPHANPACAFLGACGAGPEGRALQKALMSSGLAVSPQITDRIFGLKSGTP